MKNKNKEKNYVPFSLNIEINDKYFEPWYVIFLLKYYVHLFL